MKEHHSENHVKSITFVLFFKNSQLTPISASTSLRHNTVDVWEMRAYTEKQEDRVGSLVLYTFNRIIRIHERLSFLQ